MDAADVVRVVRADPDAYAEAFRVCTGTLWHKGLVTGLLKVDDKLIVNRGTPRVAPEARAGAGRDAAARACGEALRGMAVSRACREHAIGLHPPTTMTGALLATALEGVDWAEVGSRFLAATFARLSWQADVGAADARRPVRADHPRARQRADRTVLRPGHAELELVTVSERM